MVDKKDYSNWNTPIFEAKYAVKDGETIDQAIERMMVQVWDSRKKHLYSRSFMRRAIEDRLFVPGGRIWATAGREHPQMMNCFVVPVGDSRGEIIQALGELFEIQAHGGGVGYNFSDLRPFGEEIKSTGGVAQGGVPFISVFDALSGIINGVNDRKAANMGIVNVTYPDVLEFINTKAANPGKEWTNFNVSVGIDSPEFIESVVLTGETFHDNRGREIEALPIWDAMMQAQWECGDPGIVNFVKIQEMNNTWYVPSDVPVATNPCGEIPLPPYGVCCLGSVNLSECIRDGAMNLDLLEYAVRTGVEFLDCVLDANYYPLPKIREHSMDMRRIGLGVVGLAHALIKCGVRYGSDASLTLITEWWRVIAHTAYTTSTKLAELLEPFPKWAQLDFLDSGYMTKIIDSPAIHTELRKHGIRNSHLLTQAPTGTISMLVGASSGIEPLFDVEYTRKDRLGERKITDPVVSKLFTEDSWKEANEVVIAHDVTTKEHLAVQSAVQKWVDQSVSKTINLPESATKDDIDSLCRAALEDPYIKGITIFRDKSLPGQVLNKSSHSPESTLLKDSAPVVRPMRAKVLPSTTYHFETPQGTAYATFARNGGGGVEQIFLKVDKIGTDNAAWANALGRTLSIALRTGADPKKLAKTLIDCQSSGIVWDDLGFAKEPLMVRSLPDAVGKILMHEITKETVKTVYDALDQEQRRTTGCSVCGGPTRPEGNCEVCLECGYSPCG